MSDYFDTAMAMRIMALAVAKLHQEASREQHKHDVAGVLNARDASAEMISQICIDLVQTWAGGMTTEDMYRILLENAKTPARCGYPLVPTEGDPAYAENAALIVLGGGMELSRTRLRDQTAWRCTQLGRRSPTQRELALSVMYGMYLMARAGAQVDKVTYRNPQGQIETVAIDHSISTARLFDAVRDQYGISI